ncbi:MAG: hypothetical protein LBV41_06855 [Cytophagaceae bacterium]|jgi:uncharacterized membrane protein|nr:hypothetical protein [Cytophagaceae bacterium]
MNNWKNSFTPARKLLYCGFLIFGGTLCGIYGFTANRFRTDEIIFLIIGGIVAGISLAMIFCGIISLIKEKE